MIRFIITLTLYHNDKHKQRTMTRESKEEKADYQQRKALYICQRAVTRYIIVLHVLTHSPLTAATQVRYPASACEMVKLDMWVSSRYSGFLPHKDHPKANIGADKHDLYKLLHNLFRNRCKINKV